MYLLEVSSCFTLKSNARKNIKSLICLNPSVVNSYWTSDTFMLESNLAIISLDDIVRQLEIIISLQWRHNGLDCVSNHQPHDCLLYHLFRRRSKKTSKLHVTGLCEGNSPMIGEFPSQRASNAENVSIWWCHHVQYACYLGPSWDGFSSTPSIVRITVASDLSKWLSSRSYSTRYIWRITA